MTILLLIIIIVLIVGYGSQLPRNQNGLEICPCHDCIEARNNANLQNLHDRQAKPWHIRNRPTLVCTAITGLVVILAIAAYQAGLR